MCVFVTVDRHFSTDSQILADQSDDSVFITHQSSVISSASTGEDVAGVNGEIASRSEARLSTEDSSVDQQDG